jgi:deoxyadenosine/deoxycytidine kinase
MYIAIAGNIGSGKSTLTKLLAEHYKLEPVFEAVDENPYLEDFYKDMRQFAFHSQMFFLAKRLEQHLLQVNPASRIIQDRTIYEDAAIFALNLFEEGILSDRDYATYMQMYEAIRNTLRPPDLLIYLKASVSTLQTRIRQRGRKYEQTIEEAYLKRLNVLYERFMSGYDLSQVLVIQADTTDFLLNDTHLEALHSNLATYGLVKAVL